MEEIGSLQASLALITTHMIAGTLYAAQVPVVVGGVSIWVAGTPEERRNVMCRVVGRVSVGVGGYTVGTKERHVSCGRESVRRGVGNTGGTKERHVGD